MKELLDFLKQLLEGPQASLWLEMRAGETIAKKIVTQYPKMQAFCLTGLSVSYQCFMIKPLYVFTRRDGYLMNVHKNIVDGKMQVTL